MTTNQDCIYEGKKGGRNLTSGNLEDMANMSGDNLIEVRDQIVAARNVGKMQLHMIQNCQGLHTRMVNGSCITKKTMEIDVNVDVMGHILQSYTPIAWKSLSHF